MSGTLLTALGSRLACPVAKCERQRARLHLLDWLACVAGARASGAARIAAAIGGTGWQRAAWLGNVLEMDDVHRTALLHPGPVIWPAAMSIPGDDFNARLDAAVRGYEAMIAIGAAMDAHHYALWHPTASMGGMGAAAAVASRIGLQADGYAHALAMAGSVAGGLWHMRHAPEASTKQWHIVHCVRAGREAALIIAAGATGPLALLEGQQGLFAGLARDAGELAGGDGRWLIHSVSFKPYAACRHAHPAIDAAAQLRARCGLKPPFEVVTYRDALAFCDRPDPQSELEAKFSLQHAVAVVADGRAAEPQDFTPEAIAALAPLRAQVCVSEGAEFTARYPAHFGARVNGFAVVDTLGDPERPVSQEHLVSKLASLVRWGGLAASETDRAARLALESDDAAALDALIEDWTR